MAQTVVCTGGIGSGKSYVIKIFQNFGVPAYISDNRAKELYTENQILSNGLMNILGNDIFEDGKLRRDIMASRIFSDSSLLQKVNSLVHPFVLEDFIMWKSKMERDGHKLVLLESAIYLESSVFKGYADYVVVVTAPEQLRVKRVAQRDGVSQKEVMERISKQMAESDRLSRADFIIFADGKNAVMPQVYRVLKKLEYFDQSNM
jgi:dephospho-CoA kinase